jgi:xylulokinase
VTSLVGIDVGTSAVKALAVTPSGEVLGRAEEGYPLSTPRPGWSEQDPEAWWRATEKALAALGAEDVAGLGLSGQMHGLVALDEHLRVLRPAILWNDQRTGEECRAIEDALGKRRLIERTGNRALTGFTAPKLLWLRRHEPDVYRRLAHVVLPKDYVRYRLTGDLATDVTDASGTLLLDVARRSWSNEVIDALDLEPGWLPRVAESPQPAGVTDQGFPVAAGAGDQAAGALGVGAVAPAVASVVLGTSGVVFAATEGFVADGEARLHSFCHAAPETWHVMGVMLSAAGSLEWLRRAVAPRSSFERLTREAQRWEPTAEGLLFAPYLTGERTPHADPGARGAFTGLSIRHDRGALVRAVLEGVAYGLRDSFQLVEGVGISPGTVRVSGGGARSDLWLRIVASVLGVALERTAVDEGAAYGAALLAGVAAGVFEGTWEAVNACVRVTDTVEPDAAWTELYDAAYERFRALYPALRPLQPAG